MLSTRWYHSTSGCSRGCWGSTRQQWSFRRGRDLRRGQVVASVASSRSRTGRCRSGSSWRTGSNELDPEGRIASLEGVLHSTIHQRDNLQQTVTQLRAELERGQQMMGGASTSRDEPGRSVLEGQLAVAVRRAEDAAVELQKRSGLVGGRSEGLSSADSCARERDGRYAPTPLDRQGDRTALGGGRAPFAARERAASLRATEVGDEGAREGLGIGRAFLGQQDRHPELVYQTLFDRILRTTEE
ncbi:hypothetical protein Taro_033604 [Colocasia esculenta]|uniref:Uncharacterized protein n=1 Tax=Colocasia esculenta TaxID=4460 RepID=A0A843VYD0_COLES|nr:hypothetical protein [Colocasia esculenta]